MRATATASALEAPAFDPRTAVAVGRIVAPHGLRGELKVEPLTDFPQRFDPGSRLWLDGAPRLVQGSRWRERQVLLKLEGIDSRSEAEALRGKELMVPRAQALEAGRYYLHDVLGLRVEDESGATLGRLADVLTTGANDVYVVRDERGELLLPAIEDVVREIDVAGGRIVVALLPGLEFSRPRAGARRPGTRRPKAADAGEAPSV